MSKDPAVGGDHRGMLDPYHGRVPIPDVAPYDALLLVSFGGPEKSEDVVPFLRNVTRGRDIPEERLVEVGEHYFGFGGKSPINDQNRALLAAITEDFARRGIDVPVYWGNRNWDPYLTDALRQMKDDGVRRAACFVTSAYSSYSGCRQYREDLAAATAEVEDAPRLDRLRAYFNHPGFVQPMVDAARDALEEAGAGARLVFVTHSIPEAMNAVSGPDGGAYVAQHADLAAQIADRLGVGEHDLVYCSRSGSPHVPWLEPDVNDHLERLAGEGTTAVALMPIGFVSDHMEVVYDLDTEAKQTADRLGLGFARGATAGVDPRFVAMVGDLFVERAASVRDEDPEKAALGSLPAPWDVCAAGCCANPRGPLPTLGGMD